MLVFDNVLVSCQEDVEFATPQLGDKGATHGRGALNRKGEKTHRLLPSGSTCVLFLTIQTLMEPRTMTNDGTYVHYYTQMHYPHQESAQ